MLPWKQTSREKEQRQFIERWKRGEVSFVSLCRQFGISRKTGYKREDRFQRYGWEGLGDWSRTPRRRPNRTPLAVSERLIEVRRAYPNWGPKKMVAWLRTAEPEGSWPAPSTAGDVLDRAGLVHRRKRRRHAALFVLSFLSLGFGLVVVRNRKQIGRLPGDDFLQRPKSRPWSVAVVVVIGVVFTAIGFLLALVAILDFIVN